MKQFLLKYTFFHELEDEISDGVESQKCDRRLCNVSNKQLDPGMRFSHPFMCYMEHFRKFILPILIAVKKTIKLQSLRVYHQHNSYSMTPDISCECGPSDIFRNPIVKKPQCMHKHKRVKQVSQTTAANNSFGNSFKSFQIDGGQQIMC